MKSSCTAQVMRIGNGGSFDADEIESSVHS
jgi:hypothetical protein